ncbi:MAG: MFS transporter [Kordiimonadaceae bacterium]|nr:MFS transporter [Kordiimonadaceae bacterium]
MTNHNTSFFFTRRFLPLFITQFLGAFNDNLFRQAIVILITFGMAKEVGMQPAALNSMAAGLFILPYFLFSALAGQLADKYEKSGQIFWIKLWEVILMLIGGLGFYLSSLPLLFTVLCGLGLQSTFFGPIKYGILPDLVDRKDLLTANAYFEASTFIAILGGTIFAGLFIATGNGVTNVVLLAIGLAIVGTLVGRRVPKVTPGAPDLVITKNIFVSTRSQLKRAWNDTISKRAILGASWIWLYGSVYLAQTPVITKEHLGGDETLATLFMACSSVGIGLGSFLSSRMLKGEISAKLAKPALLAMFAVSLVFYAVLPTAAPAGPLIGVSEFLSLPFNWLIISLFISSSILSGMIIVPLYAILQNNAAPNERARMMAANNIINSGFMTGGAIAVITLLTFGLTSADALLVMGVANLLVVPVVTKLRKEMEAGPTTDSITS